jgi:hypothetical protein
MMLRADLMDAEQLCSMYFDKYEKGKQRGIGAVNGNKKIQILVSFPFCSVSSSFQCAGTRYHVL